MLKGDFRAMNATAAMAANLNYNYHKLVYITFSRIDSKER